MPPQPPPDVGADIELEVDFAAVFQAGPAPALLLTPRLSICAVNTAFVVQSGRSREQLLGRPLFDVFPANPANPHDTGVSALHASLQRVLATGRADTMAPLRYDIPDQEQPGFLERYWSAVNTPVLGADGSVRLILHRATQISDVIARRASDGRLGGLEAALLTRAEELSRVNEELFAARDQLAARVLHDPLTGLLARPVFLEELGRALARLDRHPQPLAVLFIDLDGLKFVNDTYGHSAGDELIRCCADRLRTAVRPSDPVARFGGDEFVVLLDALHSEQEAAHIAERILEQLRVPCRLDPVLLAPPSASIGVAFASARDISAETLIAHADAAMYQAKRDGRGRYALFDPVYYAAIAAGNQLQSELGEALARHQLALHYQPIIDLTDDSVHAVEALLRWQHPERGLLSAGTFIDAAESSGLLVEIGAWVLTQACGQLAIWDRTLGVRAPRRMFCNLSTQELARPGLQAHVVAALDGVGLEHDRLVLEVTETGALAEAGKGEATLESLDAIGCDVAIDDFGTGHSSLSRLVRLRTSILKIDQSFIRDIGDPGSAAVVSAVLLLAHNLRKTVVAEGIENDAARASLLELGCAYGQGYHLGMPQPADLLTRHLSRL